MNRRQKIIISVTGIFLVLLLLVGLTYGYFLTKISGNNNDKSISVTTADLKLVYNDGSDGVIGGELLIPSDTEYTKTFTVTNEGNATTDYVVVIEDVSVTYTSTVQVDGKTHTAGSKTTFTSNDFVYTLTCTSGCNGVDTETTFPITGGILVGNNIEVGKTQTYELSMKYLETGIDQSADMNKTLIAKLNIKDTNDFNPYAKTKESLAYNIINNAAQRINETVLVAKPLTIPSKEVTGIMSIKTNNEQETDMSTQSEWYYSDTYYGAQPWNGRGGSIGRVSECSDEIVGKYISYPTEKTSWYVKSCKSSTIAITADVIETKYEQTLTTTQDDYGTSYYYRGNVEDNYVEFNNMCWRIVRIEGDGSIKLTLSAQKKCSEMTSSDTGIIGSENYGYKNVDNKNVADFLNSTTGMKSKLDAWLISSGLDTSKLKQDNWCIENDKTTYEDLTCDKENSKIYSSYIGALTASEVKYAGGVTGKKNLNYYLLSNTTKYWWTLSLGQSDEMYDYAIYVYSNDTGNDCEGSLSEVPVMLSNGIRPSITLKSNTTISAGTGIQTDPYIVE